MCDAISALEIWNGLLQREFGALVDIAGVADEKVIARAGVENIAAGLAAEYTISAAFDQVVASAPTKGSSLAIIHFSFAKQRSCSWNYSGQV